VLCNLFQLQLAILHFERADVSAISATVQELLQQCEEQQDAAADSHLAQLKLHFLMLQVMMVVQSGSFKELQDSKEPKEGAAAAAQTSAIIDQMDELLHQVAGAQLQAAQQGADKAKAKSSEAQRQRQQQQQCEWLPAPLMAAAVHLLAAEVDKNAGKQKQGQLRIASGECTYLLTKAKTVCLAAPQLPGECHCLAVLRQHVRLLALTWCLVDLGVGAFTEPFLVSVHSPLLSALCCRLACPLCRAACAGHPHSSTDAGQGQRQ
jgi:hypothetical protein